MTRDNLLSLAALTCGNEVTVCGNAPCLKDELGKIRGVVFAADAAADVLDDNGIRPDAVFTDLDGATDRLIALNEEGTIVVIHAHGDNMPLLRHWVPRFTGPVVATTQSSPAPACPQLRRVYRRGPGGLCSRRTGCSAVTLVGFDLDDKNVDPMKRGKTHVGAKTPRPDRLCLHETDCRHPRRVRGRARVPRRPAVHLPVYPDGCRGAYRPRLFGAGTLPSTSSGKIRCWPSELNRSALLVMIAGVTVPGKYLGGTPATLTEIQQIGHMYRGKETGRRPDRVRVCSGRRAEGNPAGDHRVRCPPHR